MVLFTKGNADTKGIGLLEVILKVVEAVINTQIKSVVQFHNVLHGFCAVRGVEINIMELKLAQELTSMDQDPLFLAFLDLGKAYDKPDRGRLLQTQEGYGSGQNYGDY